MFSLVSPSCRGYEVFALVFAPRRPESTGVTTCARFFGAKRGEQRVWCGIFGPGVFFLVGVFFHFVFVFQGFRSFFTGQFSGHVFYRLSGEGLQTAERWRPPARQSVPRSPWNCRNKGPGRSKSGNLPKSLEAQCVLATFCDKGGFMKGIFYFFLWVLENVVVF